MGGSSLPRAFAVVVLAALALPAAAAQDLPGVYFTANEGTSSGGDQPYCSAKAYTLELAVPADGKAYHGTTTTAAACITHFVYTATGAFELSGEATAHFFVSCDQPAVIGTPATVAFRLQLRKNGEQVAQVDASGGSGVCEDGGTVTEMTVGGIDADGTSFAAGDTLALVIFAWVTGAADEAAPNFHYLVGPSRPSALMADGLPTLAAPGAGPGNGTLATETLVGEEATIQASFDNATTSRAQYSWRTNLTAARIDVEAAITGGTARLLVLDGANAAVVNQTLEDGTHAIDIPSAAPGNWSFLLQYANFTGTLDLAAGPREAVQGNASTATSSSVQPATTTDDDGRTGGFPLRNEEKTPSLGPAAVLLLLALVASAVRRRLK